MTNYIRSGFKLRMLLLPLAALLATGLAAATPLQSSLTAYGRRLPKLQATMAQTTAAAEAAAATLMAHPASQIVFPFGLQAGLSEELNSRAGGLSYATYGHSYAAINPHDVVLLATRSWQTQADLFTAALHEYQRRGALLILIGSSAGKPENLPPHYFIDNHATAAEVDDQRINALINASIAWAWVCEYAAALSRHGYLPGILQSVAYHDQDLFNPAFNRPYGRAGLRPCASAIPPAQLGSNYIARLQQMADDLAGNERQAEIARAATLIATRLAAGEKVALAGMGHMIISEVKVNNRAPWHAFRAVHIPALAIRTHLTAADTLAWFTYAGMNSRWDNYASHIAATGARLISSYAPPLEPEADTSSAADAHLWQSWCLPDAEVEIPLPPGRIAPISGINVTLQARMLDDAVADRLAELPTPTPAAPAMSTSNLEFLHYIAIRQWFNQTSPYQGLWQGSWQLLSTNGIPLSTNCYAEIGSLSNGRIAARQESLWGYLDAQGEWVIPPAYLDAAPFSDDRARVRTTTGFAIIDPQGQEITTTTYEQLKELAPQRQRRWQRRSTAQLLVMTNGLWGVIDRHNGSNVVPLQWPGLHYYAPERLAFQATNQLWGLLSMQGEVILEPRYDEIFPYANQGGRTMLNQKFGAIDLDGKEIVAPSFNYIEAVHTDHLNGDQHGYRSQRYSLSGELQATPDTVAAPVRRQQRLDRNSFIASRASLYGVVDQENNELLPFVYQELQHLDSGLMIVNSNALWGVINVAGESVIPLRYSSLVKITNERLLACCHDEWSIIAPDHTTVQQLAGYDYYTPLGNNHLKVARDLKWGVIDLAGELVIPLDYSFIYSSWRNLLIVAKEGTWQESAGAGPLLHGRKLGMIDWQNREVIPCRYEAINPYGYGNEVLAVATTGSLLPLQP